MFKAILLVIMMSGQQYVMAPTRAPAYMDLATCQANLNQYRVAAQRWVLENPGVKEHRVECMNEAGYYDAAAKANAANALVE